MALVKCPDCGKAVSDKATSCNACGCPLGGSGSVGASSFERRIEEYKRNGYKQRKRNGDTVIMAKEGLQILISVIALLVGALLLILLTIITDSPAFLGAYIPLGILIAIFVGRSMTVTILLTKTGKIEETGNVLK